MGVSIRPNVDLDEYIDEVTTAQTTIVGKIMMVVVAFHFFYVRFSTGLRFAPNLRTKV